MRKVSFLVVHFLFLSNTALAGPIFTDITEKINSWVMAMGDVDGDGRVDFVDNNGIWLNKGLGPDAKPSFQMVKQGLDFVPHDLSHMILVDVDGDGDKDLAAAEAYGDVRLYRNDSCGTALRFVDVTQLVGLGGRIFHQQTHLALSDIDGDGDLDIYATEGWPAGRKGVLYRNDSDKDGVHFTDATSLSGVVAPPACRAIVFTDFDRDGKPDLYLASHTGSSKLYLNKGDVNGDGVPNFVDVTVKAGVNISGYGNGATAGDIDNDGRMDIIQAIGSNGSYDYLKVLKNLGDTNGDGTVDFVDMGANNGVTAAVHHGAGLGDIDNDGDLDLALANFYDSPFEMFGNNGDGTFAAITGASGIGPQWWGAMTHFADIDNDGDLDLWMNRLYMNNTNNGAYLKVELLGTGLNRDAIGATLRVWPAGQTHTDENLTAYREVTAGTAFFSSDDAIVEIGLSPGNYDLEATFRSGIKKSLTGVHNGQSIRVLEAPSVYIPKRCGNKSPEADAGPDKTVACGSTVQLDGSGSNDPEGDALTYTWREGTVLLGDGKVLNVTLPFGEHVLTLVTEDGHGGTSLDEVKVLVKDTVPPCSMVAGIVGLMGSNEWYRSAVDLNLAATDACSGVENISFSLNNGAAILMPGDTAPVAIAQDGIHSLAFLAKDRAGNVEPAFNETVVKLDQTPPVIASTARPDANQYGWNRTSVQVSFSCSDAVSGVAACTEPTAITAEGAGQTVTGEATDIAGNDAAVTVSKNIDVTAPLITVTVTPQSNQSGWHNGEVKVKFTCSDSLSGIASCTTPTTVSTEGAGQVVTGTASDKADNTAVAEVTLNIDRTPPVVSISVPDVLWPPNHKLVKILPVVKTMDALSGQAKVSLLSVTSSEPDNGLGDGDMSNDIVINSDGSVSLRAERSGNGPGRVYTITYLVHDAAGNATTASAMVTVPSNL